jgi:hypothetical protein
MDLETKPVRSIGFDADENGQSRQAQHQIPIGPVRHTYPTTLPEIKVV